MRIQRTDMVVFLLFFVVLGVATVYGVIDSRNIQKDLEIIAQEKLDEWFKGDDRTKYDFVTIIEPSKAFLIFGRAWGVIHLFVRDKGDEEMNTFKGFEYYCKRSNGKWVIQDSAGCGALEHHVKAFKKMEACGMRISPKVFEKLNKS